MQDRTKIAERGLCAVCHVNPRAINYKRNGKTFYRSKCNSCLKHNARSAFRCVMCGFEARYEEQLVPVSTIKADESVCLNCDVIRNKERVIINKLKPIADF